ncbi:MAG: squalene/phytoene synthase family protein, partial [Roseobacter sp.]
AGLNADTFLADPKATKAVRAMIKRLISEANRLYMRSEAGIGVLPRGCRPGIYAARFIYAGIGGRLHAMGYDSLTARARTSKAQKLGWLGQSMLLSGASLVLPASAVLYARPLPEVRFLVDATARGTSQDVRSDALLSVLSLLEERARAQRSDLAGQRPNLT